MHHEPPHGYIGAEALTEALDEALEEKEHVMKPSIGRVVHYRSRGSADGVFGAKCRAAVITEVDTDGFVSLAVLNPTGLFFDPMVAHRPDSRPGSWHAYTECSS